MWTTLRVSKTAYDLTGPADAPVVVLIHGLGLSRALWKPFLAAFAEYRVLSYDLPGHGESPPSQDTATLAVYARQLSDLMNGLDIAQAHLVGFSIGGMINRRFVLDFPDKVASLVILNSPHDRGEAAQTAVEGRALEARNKGAFATFDAAVKRWFTADYLSTGDGQALVRAWRHQVDDESYAQASWVLAHGVRELIAPQPAITHPTLVITCENDVGSTPAMSRNIVAEIEGADLFVVPGLQHLGLMEQPQAFIGPILAHLSGN